ncbi:MAG: peptidylprolyl isomerase [Hormoscilla sp.]
MELSKSRTNRWQRWLKPGILAMLLFTLFLGLDACSGNFGGVKSSQQTLLPSGDAITDGKALLRYGLPIDNQPVREMQANLESISTALRGKRWNDITRNITKVQTTTNLSQSRLLSSVPDDRVPEAESIIAQIKSGLPSLREAAEVEDKEQVQTVRDELLELVGQLEQLMVRGMTFEVPSEYGNLPQLLGRATVAIATNKGKITVELDGYNAPVTAGNFVDLVQREFYDGLEFTRVEDSYVAQVGDPPGPEDGFIDPETGEYRTIPLEIAVPGEPEPIYGITLEEAGMYREHPVLPFAAYGTLGMARPDENLNGGSSQFFFFLFNTDLTPPGVNLLDGRYAAFGYVTEGREVLEKLTQGDVIELAKVIEGASNLVQPQKA